MMFEKILYFNTISKTVRNNGTVMVEKFCNSWEAINIGADVVIVNGVPLNPPAAGEVLGDSTTDGGWKGEIYMGRIDVAFQTAVNPQVIIKQKIYLTDKENGVSQELNKQ